MRTISFAVTLLLVAGPALAESTPGASELFTSIDSQSATNLFVPQGLGLNTTMDEIASTLKRAQAAQQLTSIEVKEYMRRLEEKRSALSAAKQGQHKLSFDQLQSISKDVSQLADAINAKLIPSAPAGATNPEELAVDYKQLREKISQRVREGRIEPTQAKNIREAAKRVYELAVASKQVDDLQDASRELHKLNDRMQSQTAFRVKPDVGNSFLFGPRVF